MRPRRLAIVGLTALSAVFPALAEARLHARLTEALGRCRTTAGCGSVGRVAIDLAGLHLHDVERSARGYRMQARRVDVMPSWAGLDVLVHGLAVAADPAAAPPQRASTNEPRDVAPSTADRVGPGTIDTAGLQVTVSSVDPVRLPRLGGAQVTLERATLVIDPAGAPRLRLRAALEGTHAGHDWQARTTGLLEARPVRGFKTWTVQGSVSIGDGPALAVQATVTPRSGSAAIADPHGGQLHLDAARAPAPTLSVRAEHFELGSFGTLLQRSADKGIDLTDATLDGAVAIGTDPSHTRFELRAHELSLSGAVVHHSQLGADPIALGALSVTGEATRGERDAAARIAATHEGVQVHVNASVDPERFELHAELPRTSCQALLDAIPSGLSGLVAGTQLDGDLQARVDWTVSRTELDTLRQTVQPEAMVEPPRPGSLEVEFPFLQQCRVERDAADLDVRALRGPYRHRFVDSTGTTRTRVMAEGSDGYVPLPDVPHVASAFVVLEDARFWQHDGFDREQIRNAWWHNLLVGRVARGASTITQQAARNLYLGIDRTLGRKLQEAFVAWRMEAYVPKRRILELYLNVIELAPGVHGVDDAARFYFGKPAAELSILQAVHLASLAPAPHTYAERFASGKVDPAWRGELDEQLRRMYLHRTITHDELLHAMADELRLLPRR